MEYFEQGVCRNNALKHFHKIGGKIDNKCTLPSCLSDLAILFRPKTCVLA
jgi:hypothetical protein